MTSATVKLEHGKFQILGPSNLVLWINSFRRIVAPDEVKRVAYKKKISDYYVICNVTGNEIPLSDLKYWNVDRQEPYLSAKEALIAYTTTTYCT